LSSNIVFKPVVVFAHSGDILTAWAAVAPTIDGVLSPEEWDDADSESFLLEYSDFLPETSAHEARIYVKNNETFLYLAVVIENDDYDPYDFGSWRFENNHDGVIEVGDDGLSVRSDGLSTDTYRTNAQIEGWWYSDANFGGTNDIVGGATHTNPNGVGDYTFECMHPLDTTDDAHDFSLELGDTVGFHFHYTDGGAEGGSDEWPGVSDYGDIVIASPPTYTLHVSVRDERGNPIEGASVYLDGQFKGETNVEGELDIHGVSEGVYVILVEKEGYLDQEVMIEVTSNLVVPVTLQLIARLPDLTVSSLTLSNQRPPEGEEVVVSAVIANEGVRHAGGFSVSFRVDANEFFSFQIVRLQAGESRVLEATWTAEGVGIRTIYTLVDSNNDVEESYDGNNELTQTIEVIPYLPDLILRELSFEPSEPRVGEEVHFSMAIENIGAAAAAGFYWSLGPCGWGSQTKLSGYVSGGLDAGALITVQTSFTYEDADSYLAVAVVDPENEVEEASNMNNALGITITVAKIKFTFLLGGKIVVTDIPIFGLPDEDDDGINDCWEKAATRELNPYLEFDEEEDLFDHPNDAVANFVRVTPYPSKENPAYIIFYNYWAFTRDYGRFKYDKHHGDSSFVAMAWEVLNEEAMKLQWVYTGAHCDETRHVGVWSAWSETCNTGRICLLYDFVSLGLYLAGKRPCYAVAEEQFCSKLEFHENRLKVQVSEDKHAIYPKCRVCEEVQLINFIGISGSFGSILDFLNALGRFFRDVFDLLFGWINFSDDKIGASQQVFLTYDAGDASRPGLIPPHELHFRGHGAHYILYWHIRYGHVNRRHVVVELDMLHCREETDMDHWGSLDDDIYLIVTGFSLYPEVDAWAVIDDPVVDQSVDSGDDCTEIFSNSIVVFDGEMSEESLIGFNVILMEHDTSSRGDRRNMVSRVRDEIFEEISSVGISHVGDCGVGAGNYVSSWLFAIGEDCGDKTGGEHVIQVEAHNVGELRRDEQDHLVLDHLLPPFDQIESLEQFGFDEPFEGVYYEGTPYRFCGGLPCDSTRTQSIPSKLSKLPSELTEKLDEELQR
jgi:hypothetical protein